jgi:hypothetical protein
MQICKECHGAIAEVGEATMWAGKWCRCVTNQYDNRMKWTPEELERQEQNKKAIEDLIKKSKVSDDGLRIRYLDSAPINDLEIFRAAVAIFAGIINQVNDVNYEHEFSSARKTAIEQARLLAKEVKGE